MAEPPSVTNQIRAFLGGISLGLGFCGLALLAVTVPYCLFMAHFWGGFSFHEQAPPPRPVLEAAIDSVLVSLGWRLLVPQILISFVLIGYGYYEGRRELSA